MYLRMAKKLSFITIFFSSQVFAGSVSNEVEEKVSHFVDRFGLEDVYQKAVYNQGGGFEDLYGTRNFRAVLHGILYRGGANNYYHRENRRDNRNPLPIDGLTNLCKEGFSTAIYLYTRNFETAPKSISCTTRKGEKNTLKYENYWYNDLELNKEILKIVHTKIKGEDVTPIYAHCWNGWHASGLIAALALRQFCNVSPERAVSYWMRGADGTADNTKAYDSLKRKIRNFTPSPSLTLTESERSLFCPSID